MARGVALAGLLAGAFDLARAFAVHVPRGAAPIRIVQSAGAPAMARLGGPA